MRKLNDKVFVKVLDSTYYPSDEKRAMIGKVYEVAIENIEGGLVGVYTPDKRDWEAFNPSDLQLMTPAFFNGVQIGIGDEVKSTYRNGKVREWITVNNDVYLVVGEPGSEVTVSSATITSHTPLHPTKKETITIGDVVYDKAEFENATKHLKPVK